MKTSSIFIIVVALLIFSNLNAQEICGTQMTADYEHHLLTKDRSHLSHSARAASNLLVPVQYHIIGQNDGSGYFTVSELMSLHCSLNEALLRTGMQFYFDQEPHYINNSNYYNFQDFNSGSAMMNEHNVSNVCNIFIVDNPAGVCGYAYYPGSGPNGGGIVLSKDCSSYNSTTLVHEMGHYMGLPHTFSNLGSGVEFVNGSNCANAGDLFCDTPADFLDFRWSCPYTGAETDPNGDLYSPVIDQSLYMSYSLDECQLRFSLMQEADMYQNLQNERPYLLNQPNAPQDVTLESIEVLQKEADLMSARQATFTWNSVPDAFMYQFQLTHYALSFTYDYDILVSDTNVFFSNLLTNTNYRWRVKPISRLNTCMKFSDYQYVKTSKIDVTFDKSTPGCSGNTDGLIEVIPVSGALPLSYEWSNGAVFNPVTSLPGGTYFVTITDNDNEKVVLKVDLPEPDQLSVDIAFSPSGVASATANGGTPPYLYQWADGTLGGINNSIQPGNVVAYVTDANGCVASKVIIIASDHSIIGLQSNINVYPNPVERNHLFMVNMTANKQTTASFELYAGNGQLISSQEKTLISGEQQVAISTQNLSEGVYLLKVVSPDHRYVQRLVITR